MKTFSLYSVTLLVLLLVGLESANAQSSDAFMGLFEAQFENASRVVDLAEAMPQESYDWRPEEGVRSVGEVYTHIVGANIYILQSAFGFEAPDNIDSSSLDSLTDKDDIVNALENMVEYVQENVAGLSESDLSADVNLFGTETNGQGALVIFLTHMSEHLGQSIAYARSNGVTPPWSE